jgi:cyclophilin family peptidyl-prolyl cis-trans isomerase
MVCKFWFSALLMALGLMAGCSEKTSKETQDMDIGPKKVKMETSMGDIVIELNEEAAPITVKNFLQYVQEGFYNGMIFHRVRRTNPAMVQGGGFTVEMVQKETHAPIVNEASNGLKNDRGTIAMARTSNPDSATAQFFINHKNNDYLNYVESRSPGYAVFGKVIEGMETVDKIAVVRTTIRIGMRDVPVEPVVIKSATVVSGG